MISKNLTITLTGDDAEMLTRVVKDFARLEWMLEKAKDRPSLDSVIAGRQKQLGEDSCILFRKLNESIG